MNKPEDKMIIVNEETGENLVMECGDDLEPLEQSIEFIDFDNPIQFTDDQLSYNLVNILSYNDKRVLENKNFWARRAREFIDLSKIISSHDSLRANLYPVIRAHKLVIVDTDIYDNIENDPEKEQEYSENFLTATSLNTVLERRVLLSNTIEPYLTYMPKAIAADRIWIDVHNNFENNFSVPMKLKKDIRGYTGLTETLRPITLFGKSNGSFSYDGDHVNVLGFVYHVHDTEKVFRFDTNKYKSDLGLLQNGDDVKVVNTANGNTKTGTVNIITDDEITIQIHKGDMVTISKDLRIEMNDVFVYHHSIDDEEIYSKSIITKTNILFTLLKDDDTFTRSFRMVLPTMSEVFSLLDMNNILTVQDLQIHIEKFGFSVDQMDESSLKYVRDVISNNTFKHINDISGAVPKKKKYRKVFTTDTSILDLEKHSNKLASYQNKYKFINNFCDSEYYRTKYIFSEGDNGLLYHTQLLQDDADKLFTFVGKNKEKLDNELLIINKKLQDIQVILKNFNCNSFKPIIKRKYTDIAELEKDNFKNLEGVSSGDFAELIIVDKKANTTTQVLYQRNIIENNNEKQEFWVRNKEVTYNTCSKENKLPNHKEFQEQECIYDERKSLCSTKEYYIAKNKEEHFNKRRTILQHLQTFYTSYDTIKKNLTENIEWLKYTLTTQKQGKTVSNITYEDKVDYSDFVGNPEEDDEDRLGKAEQGEGVVYRVMRNQDEDENSGLSQWLKTKNLEDKKDIGDMVENLVNQLGIELTSDDITYIRQNLEYYHNETKLNNSIAKMKKTLYDAAKNQIEKVTKQNKALATQITKKYNKDRDDKISKNLTLLQSGHHKNVIAFISAMYIVLVQLKLPDIVIKIAYPSCMKHFGLQGPPLNTNPKSLLKYVSCIIKEISIPKDEVFDVFSHMSLEQIEKVILEQINIILKDKVDFALKLEQITQDIDVKKTKEDIFYNEWTSYRPVLNLPPVSNSDNNIVKYISMIIDLSKNEESVQKLTPELTFISPFKKYEQFNNLFKLVDYKTSLDKNKGFGYYAVSQDLSLHEDDLFIAKPIEIKNTETVVKSPPLEYNIDVHDITIQSAIHEKLDNEEFWDFFPNRVEELFVNLWSKYQFNPEVINDVTRLLLSIDEKSALKVKNSLKNILFDDLKTLLGKIKNNWTVNEDWLKKLPQLDKKKREYEKVKEILKASNGKIYELTEQVKGDNEFHSELNSVITSLTTTMLRDSELYEIKDKTSTNMKKNIYVYDYVLLNVLYSLVHKVIPGSDDIFDIDHIQTISNISDPILKRRLITIFELVQFLLSTTIDKLKRNIFDTKDILRRNEVLREGRKNDTISRLDKLTTEERKMTLELQKLRIINWADIPEHKSGEEDIDDGKVNKDDDNERDMYDVMNENEENENYKMEFKGRDGDDNENDDDDENDAWLADDE